MNEVLLYIGGTDPSGGAGLAADLKTAAALGFHGCQTVSALTVQNSGNVSSWEAVPSGILLEQLKAICDDGPVAGVKSGMLGSTENASSLAGFIKDNLSGIPYVLDPVLAASGGSSISCEGMAELLRDELIPLSTLCTPNISEAQILAGLKIRNEEDMIQSGRAIIGFGTKAALIKGGHLTGNPVDILVTGSGSVRFAGSRITSENVHGTGCTLGSAITAYLAAGYPLESAVRNSREYVRRVIARRISRIHGNLPGHFPKAGPFPKEADGSSFYLPPAYCPMCTEPLGRLPGEFGHLFCSTCGYVHYRNPLPAVALMVHDGEKILLVKRAVPPKKGMLSLPGGFLETGETPEECGHRELLEETGLRVTASRLMELETDLTAYGGILLAVMEVTGWKGTAVAGDDASEVIWVRISEVPELAFSAHDRMIKRLQKTLFG